MTIVKAAFSELQGKTLASVVNTDNERLTFKTVEGQEYRMGHHQQCCEFVTIEDICGELQDLVGSPILLAEEVTSESIGVPHYQDSFTWTFYKLATVKSYVTIRWYGTSNGYYSEKVDFVKVA